MTYPAIISVSQSDGTRLDIARIECKDRTDAALIKAFRAWAKRHNRNHHERYTVMFANG